MICDSAGALAVIFLFVSSVIFLSVWVAKPRSIWRYIVYGET